MGLHRFSHVIDFHFTSRVEMLAAASVQVRPDPESSYCA